MDYCVDLDRIRREDGRLHCANGKCCKDKCCYTEAELPESTEELKNGCPYAFPPPLKTLYVYKGKILYKYST